MSQKTFLDNLFSQLIVLINESKQKYASRVEKTFHSIKDIFNEKCVKMAKFDREMKELEKDVRLNYTNIIKLMDLEPFYEIIYRYNKKLNNIKAVFAEFKGKPDEIPEDAIRVKSLKSQMSFVKGFSRKLEHFFVDDDSFDSNNISQDIETDRLEPGANLRELDFEQLPEVWIEAGRISKQMANKGIQTDGIYPIAGGVNFVKKVVKGSHVPPAQSDELKVQAEMLIKSVDTLIANGDVQNTSASALKSAIKTAFPGGTQRTSPDQKQSKSISKAEIAKRIQAHFQSGSNIGKVRSVSNSNGKSGAVTVGAMSPMILEKKQALNRELDFGTASREISTKNRESKSRQSKEKLPAALHPSQIFLSNFQSQKNYTIPGKQRMLKQNSAGHMPNTGTQEKEQRVDNKTLTISKTERILQIYRKTKHGVDSQLN